MASIPFFIIVMKTSPPNVYTASFSAKVNLGCFSTICHFVKMMTTYSWSKDMFENLLTYEMITYSVEFYTIFKVLQREKKK